MKKFLLLALLLVIGVVVAGRQDDVLRLFGVATDYVQSIDIEEEREKLMLKKEEITIKLQDLQADLLAKKEEGIEQINDTVEAVQQLQKALADVQAALADLGQGAENLQNAVRGEESPEE